MSNTSLVRARDQETKYQELFDKHLKELFSSVRRGLGGKHLEEIAQNLYRAHEELQHYQDIVASLEEDLRLEIEERSWETIRQI